MPKCRENRKRRLKRNLAHLDHVLHKRLDREALKQSGGKSPRYYRVLWLPARLKKLRGTVLKGQRWIDPTRQRFRVVARPEYFDLMRQLLELSTGIVWQIPPELLTAARDIWLTPPEGKVVTQ